MQKILIFFGLFHGHIALGAAVDFSHDIVPILKQHCGECHSGSQKKGGYSINSRASLLAGGESGPAVIPGRGHSGELIARVTSKDEFIRMPPEGDSLTATEIDLLSRWIDQGAPWQDGFTFGPQTYEPQLQPRRPVLPPPQNGRTNPVDRILDAALTQQNRELPPRVDDATFLRRASLDLIGLLPTPAERTRFLADPSPEKRAELVRSLLYRDVDYAEHWLTFWNDLLRNDYAGTGFITGGRTQISEWLYDSLVTNKPYDQFARELIAPPTPQSAGFANGIRWRGEVSAGQTVEIQFAQSVGQTFLGINLKCASCHDSFIDRWTLDEAYGLAAIYADRPLELHRCDQPIGKTAQAAWLFPELGQIDPQASQQGRLQQLADLMTHRQNGRFTRTIVNRLWHRLMGRGIVHPVDAMQSEPWNSDLLDFLAEDLAENGYNLKRTLALIATSEAYQSQAERVVTESESQGYQYAGPRSKRLTAEQFMDCVWQITSTAPSGYDAPFVRGRVDIEAAEDFTLAGQWIWNRPGAAQVAAGETIAFRKTWEWDEVPGQMVAVVTCDNEYTLYVNEKKIDAGTNWEQPRLVPLSNLKPGRNELILVGKNSGQGPNPAALFFEARWTANDGQTQALATDGSWEWNAQIPNKSGKYPKALVNWQAAAVVDRQQVWMARLEDRLKSLLARGESAAQAPVRASLLKSDFLMRSLGRPNRDQIVSVRPLELTTLEAINLTNGEALAGILRQGAIQLNTREWKTPSECVRWLFQFALSRQPSSAELAVLVEPVGPKLSETEIEDILWAVVMLPEFQFVR